MSNRLTPSAETTEPESETRPGILVVDDDQMLLALLKTVFQQAGFAVWSAATGTMAIDLYRRHREEIDVVLLDVRMPGLDGPQTLAELRQIDPFVPCCFMSGYAGPYSPEELEQLGALRCFQKPFRTQEMAEALLEIVRQQYRRSA